MPDAHGRWLLKALVRLAVGSRNEGFYSTEKVCYNRRDGARASQGQGSRRGSIGERSTMVLRDFHRTEAMRNPGR
jgi:hypothetical protein